MIQVKEILSKKYQSEKLGHLYILRSPLDFNDSEVFLQNWTEDFLVKNCEKDIQQITAHPDFLFIKNDSESDYKLGDEKIKDFFKFLQYRPFELKHRFIIIDKAHLINEQLSNKFLISFESPPKSTTIFLLDPLGKKLLPTITSRAITINIPLTASSADMDNFGKDISFSQFLSKKTDSDNELLEISEALSSEQKLTPSAVTSLLKGNKALTHKFLQSVIEYEVLHGDSFIKKEKILDDIKWFKEVSTYSNAHTEVLSSILSTII